MKSFFRLLLLVPILSLCGCLTVEETLVFNRDGSGTVQLVYRIDEAFFPAFTAAQAEIAPASAGAFTDAALARRQFTGHSVELREFTSYKRQGQQNIRLQCHVGDMQRGLASGLFGEIVYVRLEDGTYRLRLLLPAAGQPADAATAARLRERLKGVAIQFAVQVPGKIIEAPGAEVRGGTARWSFDAAQDDSFLRATPVIECLFTGPES